MIYDVNISPIVIEINQCNRLCQLKNISKKVKRLKCEADTFLFLGKLLLQKESELNKSLGEKT